MQRINFQPISKIEKAPDGVVVGHHLLVHSIFFTIQGEGPNVGKPAVFVRLGGCNLQCPGCDTEYTHSAANERLDSIITRIRMAFGNYAGERLVVITGGEPLRQPIGMFTSELIKEGLIVQVETNGTCGFHSDYLWWVESHATQPRPQIVVSPKASKVHEDLFPFITAYKYVLDANHIDSSDGLPESVLGMPARPARPHEGFEGIVYVQPADEPEANGFANRNNMKAAVQSAMKFGYRLCIQTHKIAEVA